LGSELNRARPSKRFCARIVRSATSSTKSEGLIARWPGRTPTQTRRMHPPIIPERLGRFSSDPSAWWDDILRRGELCRAPRVSPRARPAV